MNIFLPVLIFYDKHLKIGNKTYYHFKNRQMPIG